MTRELFNLAELLAAAGIGVCVGGVVVFLATVWMRNDAAADRAVAADDLARVAAGLVRMESARQLLPLHPAYQAHTAQFEMIRDDREPEPAAPVEETAARPYIGCELPFGNDVWCGRPIGHDGECVPKQVDELPVTADAPVPAEPGTALVLVDEPPVTADDLAPIGPDHMPRLTFWGRVALGAALLPLLVALVLLALAVLARVGWDRAGEWRADRRRRRETESVDMELAHPAPADVYPARHRAPAGRWWWSR